jgi:hypothetical protein
MQKQSKKSRPLPVPLGLKQFIFAVALFSTLFGWRAFAQSEVIPTKAVVPKEAQRIAGTANPQVRPKQSAPQIISQPRPTPVALTRSSR